MTPADDDAPYGTSLRAALGLGTPDGWAIVGTLVVLWAATLGWWVLLLAIPAAILALPPLRGPAFWAAAATWWAFGGLTLLALWILLRPPPARPAPSRRRSSPTRRDPRAPASVP